MRVNVQYLAQMRRAAGCSAETVDLPVDCSLGGLLSSLADLHPPDLRPALLDDIGLPRRSLLLFVNDAHADLTRPLRDGDTVAILAPMSGG